MHRFTVLTFLIIVMFTLTSITMTDAWFGLHSFVNS